MVDTGNYARHFTGKWYGVAEAQEIQTKLQLNCATGDSWRWVDRSGNEIALSGSYPKKELVKEEPKIPRGFRGYVEEKNPYLQTKGGKE